MVTIKDVAAASGLNVGTVSRVINNRGYISRQTREKVEQSMRALNYHPNEVARSLSKQRTHTIGLIVPHITHPYFASLIDCVEQAAWDRGCKLLICSSHADKSREKFYLELCSGNRVDGVILCSVEVDSALFAGLNMPVVVFERGGGQGTLSVVCDNYEGGKLAARRLLESGCRSLLCIGGVHAVDMPADERTCGFALECRNAKTSYTVISTPGKAYDQMDYHDFLREALMAHEEFDGIFASSDIIAAQAIQICAGLGRRVPEDVQIIGFDDVLPSRLTTPTITSIRQPIDEMAKAAISLIEAKLRGEEAPEAVKLPVSLVERGSTRTLQSLP